MSARSVATFTLALAAAISTPLHAANGSGTTRITLSSLSQLRCLSLCGETHLLL